MRHLLPPEIERVLLTPARIRGIVGRLAQRIDADLAAADADPAAGGGAEADFATADAGDSGDVVLVGVLKSVVHFLSDLSRRLRTPHQMDFITARSYGGRTCSSGAVEIVRVPELDLRGRRVLLVEDIYDTGRTMAAVLDHLRALAPRSLDACALLSKPEAHVVPVEVRYVGVEIPNRFVVGYGLDHAERFRDLPYVGILRDQSP